MKRLYLQLLDLCGLLAGIGFALVALVTAYDVLIRNLFGESIRGLIDVVEYVLFAVTFLAAPWVLRHNGHVQVDFAVRILPRAIQRQVLRLSSLIGLVISLLLLYYSVRVTWGAWQQGNLVLKAIIFPEWWVYTVICFSSVLLAVEFALRLFARSPQDEIGMSGL